MLWMPRTALALQHVHTSFSPMPHTALHDTVHATPRIPCPARIHIHATQPRHEHRARRLNRHTLRPKPKFTDARVCIPRISPRRHPQRIALKPQKHLKPPPLLPFASLSFPLSSESLPPQSHSLPCLAESQQARRRAPKSGKKGEGCHQENAIAHPLLFHPSLPRHNGNTCTKIT
jgi:hypothetical protein